MEGCGIGGSNAEMRRMCNDSAVIIIHFMKMLLSCSVYSDFNTHSLQRQASSFLLIINDLFFAPCLSLTGRGRNNRTGWLPTAIYANNRSTEISNKQEEIAYVLG
jgi:hypothetical protein